MSGPPDPDPEGRTQRGRLGRSRSDAHRLAAKAAQRLDERRQHRLDSTAAPAERSAAAGVARLAPLITAARRGLPTTTAGAAQQATPAGPQAGRTLSPPQRQRLGVTALCGPGGYDLRTLWATQAGRDGLTPRSFCHRYGVPLPHFVAWLGENPITAVRDARAPSSVTHGGGALTTTALVPATAGGLPLDPLDPLAIADDGVELSAEAGPHHGPGLELCRDDRAFVAAAAAAYVEDNFLRPKPRRAAEVSPARPTLEGASRGAAVGPGPLDQSGLPPLPVDHGLSPRLAARAADTAELRAEFRRTVQRDGFTVASFCRLFGIADDARFAAWATSPQSTASPTWAAVAAAYLSDTARLPRLFGAAVAAAVPGATLRDAGRALGLSAADLSLWATRPERLPHTAAVAIRQAAWAVVLGAAAHRRRIAEHMQRQSDADVERRAAACTVLAQKLGPAGNAELRAAVAVADANAEPSPMVLARRAATEARSASRASQRSEEIGTPPPPESAVRPGSRLFKLSTPQLDATRHSGSPAPHGSPPRHVGAAPTASPAPAHRGVAAPQAGRPRSQPAVRVPQAGEHGGDPLQLLGRPTPVAAKYARILAAAGPGTQWARLAEERASPKSVARPRPSAHTSPVMRTALPDFSAGPTVPVRGAAWHGAPPTERYGLEGVIHQMQYRALADTEPPLEHSRAAIPAPSPAIGGAEVGERPLPRNITAEVPPCPEEGTPERRGVNRAGFLTPLPGELSSVALRSLKGLQRRVPSGQARVLRILAATPGD